MDNYMDRGVRGHEFLTYFRSHLMTICLVFWFFTISISVSATAIYLIKKMEYDSKQTAGRHKNDRDFKRDQNNESREAESEEDDIYMSYDIIDFLKDAFLTNNETASKILSEKALQNQTDHKATVTLNAVE